MESLGGNKEFGDRFVAQHVAFFYYWLVVALYIISPAVAYDLNKHVERHAYLTYDEFLTTNEDMLKTQSAPQVAIDYYQTGDLYMFDAMQYTMQYRGLGGMDQSQSSTITTTAPNTRRPVVENLYDGA